MGQPKIARLKLLWIIGLNHKNTLKTILKYFHILVFSTEEKSSNLRKTEWRLSFFLLLSKWVRFDLNSKLALPILKLKTHARIECLFKVAEMSA